MPTFVFTQQEVAACLRVPSEAVSVWLRRGELRTIALTSTGKPLFDLRDVEAIGRRLAAMENVRVLWPNRQGTSDASRAARWRAFTREATP
jgi:hypothetical protein